MERPKGFFTLRMMIACAIFALLYHWSKQYSSFEIVPLILGLIAIAYGIAALWGLRGIFTHLPLLWMLNKPTGIYGTSYKPNVKDAVSFGLSLDDKNGDGIPIAALNGKRLFYMGNSHCSFVASNGAGKSASFSIPIGFHVGAHRSFIFTGKGSEMAETVGAYRRDVLGQDVYIVDPWNISTAQHYCINAIGDLHEFVDRQDPEALDIARSRALILIPDGKGENKFFSDYAQPILTDAFIYGVWNELDCGELSGNLPWLYEQFSGSQSQVKEFLSQMSRCEIYDGRISRSAQRLLSMLNEAPKTGMTIIAELTNALTLFDPATTLGQNIICSDLDITLIKKKPITIGICIPPDKINSHGAYAGLLSDMLISASMRAREFEPKCVFCLDEFGNIARGEIPAIRPAQYLGRSLGTQLLTFVQDTSIFERYEEPSAFVTQSEVYMAWSIRSTKDAEELSKRSGNTSVMVENTNLPQGGKADNDGDPYSVSLSEKSIPLYRPDEFLQMDDYKAALFYKQNPPIMTDLVHYQSIKEWADYAISNPNIQIDNVPILYKL